MAAPEKKYGLIDPKAKPKPTVADVFNNDSDSDDGRGSKDWIKKKLQKDSERGLKKQTVIDMNRALDEDPTVYQYDEVYDRIKEKEVEAFKKQAVEKKPKYMNALLKTAVNRKNENDRRTQRLIQKERRAEGEIFKDKEEFITSAYREKLEDMKKAEEHEKKMEYIESVMDVTKQKDLGGFYRHLYKETVASSEKSDVKEEENTGTGKEEGEIESDSAREVDKNTKNDDSSSPDSSSSDSDSSDSSSSDSSDMSNEKGTHDVKEDKKETSSDKTDTEEAVKVAKPETVEEKPAESKEASSKPEEKREQEKRPIDNNKETDSKEPAEKKAKFEPASTSRKDRHYRQRESSTVRESPVRERRKSPVRQDDRSKLHRDDRAKEREREKYRGRERGREHERGRERDRRDEKWGSGSRDGHSDYKSRDSRKQRSRSREKIRMEQEKKVTSQERDKRQADKSTAERKEETKKRTKMDEKEESKKMAKEEKVVEKTVKESMVAAGKENKEAVEKKSVVIKVDIWKKRTVGAVFDSALERYFQRRANRGG